MQRENSVGSSFDFSFSSGKLSILHAFLTKASFTRQPIFSSTITQSAKLGKTLGRQVPRRVAPRVTMRRWPKRFFRCVDLPYSVGTIGVARRPIQNARPEHEPLDFLAAGFHDALITNFGHDNGHPRGRSQRVDN